MATREEARDRYSSADVLAADLRALLEHRVVEARRGSTAYTVRRFFRRHWVSVSAGSVTVAALAAGLLVAHAERAVAERRFNEVRQLSKELFDLDGEISALPGSTQARHKLVSTSLAYLERLRPDALQDRSLALEIGSGYLRVARAQGVPSAPNLGQAEEAERSLGKARELLNLVRAAEPENREALLLSLQIAQDGMILAEVGRREAEAKSLGRETISLAERLLASGVLDGGEAAPILATFANVSLALSNLGEWAESAAYGERCGSLVRMKAPRIPAGIALPEPSANAYRHLGKLEQSAGWDRGGGRDVEAAWSSPGRHEGRALEFGVLLAAWSDFRAKRTHRISSRIRKAMRFPCRMLKHDRRSLPGAIEPRPPAASVSRRPNGELCRNSS
ncbi:MAG: hypothetical protein U5J83_00880 [Bryobacterales bacterium]|nr:hypothetical protein [Bryobacterales bacterium]